MRRLPQSPFSFFLSFLLSKLFINNCMPEITFPFCFDCLFAVCEEISKVKKVRDLFIKQRRGKEKSEIFNILPKKKRDTIS